MKELKASLSGTKEKKLAMLLDAGPQSNQLPVWCVWCVWCVLCVSCVLCVVCVVCVCGVVSRCVALCHVVLCHVVLCCVVCTGWAG